MANEGLLEHGGGRKSRRGSSTSGNATWFQTLGNIVVSIIGTGVLGLPYAFKVAGWFAGTLGVSAAGIATLYCMILLVQCRDKIEQENEENALECVYVQSYGDLGEKAFGTTGRFLTELLVVVSQAGGAIAYLVFIGQNLSSLSNSSHHLVAPYVFIFIFLLPLQILLSFIRSLSAMAPISVFADACNVLAMAIVVKQDIQLFGDFTTPRHAFNGPWSLPFACGVAVFCFEGFSLTLPLEASMADKRPFRWVLSWAFFGITLVYILFGIFGYLAYGDETRDIITLNLPNNWSSIAVKVGLCIALSFTFPIMMHPIHEIMERKLNSSGSFQKLCHKVRDAEWFGLHGIRVLMVTVVALVASLIPRFGDFISLVGSTVCALLSFVLPSTFHLMVMGSSLSFPQRILDYFILIVGLVFAGYGIYSTASGRTFGL